MNPGAVRVAAVLAAAAAASTMVAAHEGWIKVGYRDPVGIPTACAGHTGGVVLGRPYTEAECVDLLAQDLIKHGLEIDRCLTVPLPVKTRAAFTSFAFNVGTSRFCSSSLARKANSGDLFGACAELSRWTYAGKTQLPGLVRRRAAERAYCEQGIREGLT